VVTKSRFLPPRSEMSLLNLAKSFAQSAKTDSISLDCHKRRRVVPDDYPASYSATSSSLSIEVDGSCGVVPTGIAFLHWHSVWRLGKLACGLRSPTSKSPPDLRHPRLSRQSDHCRFPWSVPNLSSTPAKNSAPTPAAAKSGSNTASTNSQNPADFTFE
jgi:hypothetical protein